MLSNVYITTYKAVHTRQPFKITNASETFKVTDTIETLNVKLGKS